MPNLHTLMDLKDLPPGERAKIAALVTQNKQNETDWMYNQTKEDTEAYLLGKPVSDAEPLQKLGRDYEESSFQRLARIDMEAKFREDPLTAMKQRESEKRMELLRNTAKVKKLRRLLATQKQLNEKQHKRRRVKKHKQRSHPRSSSRSSSSDSDSGDQLLDKFIKIVRQSDEHEQSFQQPKVNKSSSSRSSHELSPKGNSKSAQYHSRPSTSHPSKKSTKRPKLSKEELDARRAQMVKDAQEHQEARSIRTSRHLRESLEEETRERESRGRYGASFISTLKNEHTQRSSIEEGIHRKASSRQRDDAGSNFLRR